MNLGSIPSLPARNLKFMKKKNRNKKEDTGFIRFMKVVNPKLDPILMILKALLLAEYYIDQIISLEIPRGDILLDNNFTFSQKLIMVKALNVMDNSLWDSINALNKLRNRGAHDMEYKISETDIDKIGFPQGKTYTELKEKQSLDKKTLLHLTLISTISPLDGLFRHIIQGHRQVKNIKNK